MGSGSDSKNRVILDTPQRVWTEEIKGLKETPTANSRQVAGEHYKGGINHWDWVLSNDLGYLEGCITKYVCRWKKKNGIEDLKKAQHYLEKLIESIESGVIKDPTVKSSQEKYEENMSRAFLASTI